MAPLTKSPWLAGAAVVLCCALPLLIVGGVVSLPWIGGNVSQVSETPWSGIGESRARLIAGSNAGEQGTIDLGLEISLAPGFKTYWRGAAYGGFPPQIDFSQSKNVADAQVRWPVPRRFQLHGSDVVGYESSVIFPVQIIPDRPNQPIRAQANIRYLACSAICIPMDAQLVLDLDGPVTTARHDGTLRDARARVPRRGGGDLSISSVATAGSQAAPLLNIGIRAVRGQIADPDVLIEYAGDIGFSRPSVQLSPDRRAAMLTVSLQDFVGNPVAEDLLGKTVTVTVMDGGRAVEAVRKVQ